MVTNYRVCGEIFLGLCGSFHAQLLLSYIPNHGLDSGLENSEY